MVSIDRHEWEQLQTLHTYLRACDGINADIAQRWSRFALACDHASKLTDVHTEIDRTRADVATLLASKPAPPVELVMRAPAALVGVGATRRTDPPGARGRA